MKKLTIAIPCYNSKKYIQGAFKSLERIYNFISPQFDLILVNDGSQEDYDYSDCPIPYKMIVLEKNQGQSHARQVAIDECETEWITFMDADDELMQSVNYILTHFLTEDKYDVVETQVLVNGMDKMFSGRILHGKFYRVKMLREENIRFGTNMRFSEDTFFQRIVDLTLLGRNRVAKVDIATYNWKVHRGSAATPEVGSFYELYMDYFIASMLYSTEIAASKNPKVFDNQFDELCYELYNFYYLDEMLLEINNNNNNLTKNRELIAYYIEYVCSIYEMSFEDIKRKLFLHPEKFKAASWIYGQIGKSSSDIIERNSFGYYLDNIVNPTLFSGETFKKVEEGLFKMVQE